MRELAIKRLLFGLLGYVFTGLPTLIDGGWMLLNPDRQCVHDRMVGTLVVVHREPFAIPRGPAPRPDLSGVALPPPAPPAILPPERPRPPAPAPAPQPAAPAAPAAPPPPLLALEQQREGLSQFEYERRRADLMRRLREAGETRPDG